MSLGTNYNRPLTPINFQQFTRAIKRAKIQKRCLKKTGKMHFSLLMISVHFGSYQTL